ncbi:ECF-type sigma factor [Aureliella helgolandensis]|uniref:ECF sigma factor n=1 Tax=Aureliella helgolandensis TaxID=2527968 RepID=A0A518GDZ9_9BACT|nr:ECF-type sigma factor [Aureliella helgolandensis]QDV26787.1 ECF sigma factor [Aureliella helgolandensis]
MHDVTYILSQIESGDSSAAAQLLPLVYQELRKLAAAKLANEKPGQTLQATALVHEAYLRLVNVQHLQSWDSRGHFFAAAAEAIRRILIEQARRKAGPKAGGNHRRIEVTEFADAGEAPDWDLLDLDEALVRLETEDPRAAQVVKLRFFAGLTRQESAQALGISIATADNDWAYAKGWLQVQLDNVIDSED